MKTAAILIGVLVGLRVVIIILAVLAILYLLMIMPRLTNRRERKKFLSVYYAHRGLHDNETDAPENSMSAFRRAVEAKANPANFLLMHAMGPNVAGVIGTAVAAGTMLAMLSSH